MQVKITTAYTRAEVLEIVTQLASNGLLNTQELGEAKALFAEQTICFFDLNDLLQPFSEKFVSYSKEEQSMARLTRDTVTFYKSLTLRLLQGCPLRQHTPTFALDSSGRELTIQVGSLSNKFSFSTLPEYEIQVLSCLNQFLRQYEIDAAYHEIEYEDCTIFLLLSAQQYDCLFTNRLLQFARVEYPEVEVWRKTIRLEDLLF
jgi:hypothetical protein